MIVDLDKKWMNSAMPCRTKDPEMFFFNNGQGTLLHPSPKVQKEWNRAKAVCGSCPVMRECARDNLGEFEGVWGGLDPAQRIKLRARHAQKVHKLTGPVKEEYAKLAYDLRVGRRLPISDVARIMGLTPPAVQYLHDWWKKHLTTKAEAPAVIDLELPEEAVATVTEITPNAEFPDRPPKEGDAWIRYGRRVVWGYYLGQTADDRWYLFRAKLQTQEHSACWFKAEDVKLTRKVARKVETRAGNGSRIYGTTISQRRPAEAG